MPVQCESNVLTGQDGFVSIKPAGTQHCLADYSDFGDAGDLNIQVPLQHDYWLGDPVVFSKDDGAKLDSAFTVGTTYYVRTVGPTFIQLSATKGGDAIAMQGDGGKTGTGVASVAAGTPGAGYANGTYKGVQLLQGINSTARATVKVTLGVPVVEEVTTPGSGYTDVGSVKLTGGNDGNGNRIDAAAPTTEFIGDPELTARDDSPGAHVQLSYAEYAAICQVESFTINMTRDKIETTAIPCKVGGGATKYAPFRTYQSGYADGTGTINIRFTSDTQSLSNRIAANALLRNQAGAWAKLYLNAVGDTDGIVDPSSLYIEAPISLEGFNVNVQSGGNTPTTASMNFSVSGLPRHLFDVDLYEAAA